LESLAPGGHAAEGRRTRSGKRDGGACPRRAAVIAEPHSSDAYQVSFLRIETHAYHHLAGGRNPRFLGYHVLGSMPGEKERRPARGAPAAFRSGGAAFILRVEQLGRGLRATPECRSSLVRTSYSVIGLLTYLCAGPRPVARRLCTRKRPAPWGAGRFAGGSMEQRIRCAPSTEESVDLESYVEQAP